MNEIQILDKNSELARFIYEFLHSLEDSLDKVKMEELKIGVQKLTSLIKQIDKTQNYLQNNKIYLF